MSIRFTWSPATDSLSSTLNYLVTITDGNGTILVEDALTHDTSYTFYPTQGMGTYYAKVRALDMAGNIGEYSPLSDGVDIVLQKSIIREYDANGNMTVVKEDVGGQVETLSILVYDASDKLKTYTEDSLVTTMIYDGDGRRVRKTLEDTASSTVESDISYLYDGRRILYEVDETGLEPSNIAIYVYGINLIARLEGISGSTAYYFYNGHGDVTGLVDIYGVLMGSFDYEAFGDILEETWIGETPFKYAEEYLDKETGLYLMGARYYAPEMGRWITEDPYKGSVGDPLSLNLFVFVRNSPLIYVDPSGFAEKCILSEEEMEIFAKANSPLPGQLSFTETMNMEAQKAGGGLLRGAGNSLCSFFEGIKLLLSPKVLIEQEVSEDPTLTVYEALVKGYLKLGGQILVSPIRVVGEFVWTIPSFDATAEEKWEVIGRAATSYAIGRGLKAAADYIPRTYTERLNYPLDLSLVEYPSGPSLYREWFFPGVTEGTSKTVTYSPANPGPLKKSVAESFGGATYKEAVLTQDTTFYRVYGGSSGKVGSYMTRVPQNGGMQSQIDLALNPQWGNTAQYVTKVTVPKGTVIYEGTAAAQTINGGAGQLIGGGNQIYIPEVNANWFK
jgi:RHS repeat-associated protein